ncbi:MAG: PT domain-containing protein [Clostridia bacterium]|nr:PT domain-containing protein [Clostridia bacterium]
MKKVLVMLVCICLLAAIGCQASPEQPLIIATQQPRPEPTAAPTEEPQPESTTAPTEEPLSESTTTPTEEPRHIFPLIWHTDSWDYSGDIMSIDLFGDGSEDIMRYASYENAVEPACDLFINDLKVTLEIDLFGSLAILGYDETFGCFDILVYGDACSCDYIIYQLRYDGTSLSVVSSHYGFLYSVTADEIVICKEINMFGTWSSVRNYVMKDGLLTPTTEIWTNLENDMSEDAEYSCVLTLKKALPVTASDGTATELPVGTRLIPISFIEDESVTIITADGTEYLVTVSCDEGSWEPRINGIEESEYFEDLMYAG